MIATSEITRYRKYLEISKAFFALIFVMFFSIIGAQVPYIINRDKIAIDSYNQVVFASLSAQEYIIDNNATCKDVFAYQFKMMHIRSLSILNLPMSRIQYLGRDLCTEGRKLNEIEGSYDNLTDQILSNTWVIFLKELIENIQNESQCSVFYNYHKLGWKPSILLWPSFGSYIKNDWLPILHQDTLWDTVWKNPILSGNNFLRDLAPKFQFEDNFIKYERGQHVFHIFVLYQTTSMFPHDFQQIVEFGAGSGDNAALFQEMSFNGKHFIIDLPPMLLLQRYFLRFSGWPAILGKHISADFNCYNIILENSDKLTLFHSHFNWNELDKSLFIATWSLSESPLTVRNKMKKIISNFGVLLIVFQAFFEMNNRNYFVDFAKELALTHSICVWKMTHSNDYYFVARKLSVGNVVCLPETGCSQKSLIFSNQCYGIE